MKSHGIQMRLAQLGLARRVCGAALLLLLISAETQASFIVVLDDRAAFELLLTVSPASTVIDSAGNFAGDPVAGTVDFVQRSGSLQGETFEYRVYDVDFSSSPSGTIQPGVVGGDIADLDRVTVELPAGQGGASGLGSWGVDSGAGSTQTANALVVDFVTTPGDDGVGHFGVDLLDFESSAEFGAAQLRVYDDGQLVYQQPLLWDSDNGNNVSHFVGIVAGSTDAMFDQVALVVGDDDGNGVGSERWAADRLTFGRATNPEPTSGMLALGVTALVAGARRFRRRSAGSTDS